MQILFIIFLNIVRKLNQPALDRIPSIFCLLYP